MARVNVETRAIAEGRFYKLMAELKMSRIEAIGFLVLFWHDSQERAIWKTSKEKIMLFLPIEDCERAFEALLKYEYISDLGDANFVIHGNRKHVEAIEGKKKQGQKGGIKSGISRAKKLTKSNSTKQQLQVSEPIASKIEPNSMQFNAIQCNADQFKAEKKEENTLAPNAEETQQELLPNSPSRGAAASSRGLVSELAGDETVELLLSQVTRDTQKAWLKIYPTDLIVEEVKKANIWMVTNPQKRPKQFGRFMSNWLSNAYERYRKGIPTRRLTNAEVNQQAAADLYRRNQEGTL